MRPTKIDLYIFKKFILSFSIGILLIIGIVIIFDISEKIDDFVAKEAPLSKIIFDYYLNFIPYFINMFSPMFVFMAVIFFSSRMAANSEIIAILSCGISYHRMLVPYMVSATLIAALSLGLNLFVIPYSNAKRIDFEAKYVKHRRSLNDRNVHYQIGPGQYVFVESFSQWNNTAYKFTLEEIKNNQIISKLSADMAEWDDKKGAWRLKKYFKRDYLNSGIGDIVAKGEILDTVINMTVLDFYRNKKTVETLNYNALNQLIKMQQMRGDANVVYAQIEKHTRLALPFSAFILTIIGLSLSSQKKRGSIGWNIGIGIGLSFAYILFLRFSQMFVFSGTLSPAISLWLPNVIFAVIAAYLYKKAPK